MLGLMQHQPLLISAMLEHAERHHGDGQIVSRRVEGDIHRYTYKDLAARARQIANALDAEQCAPGERVATLAWNGYRHMELYFGVSGSGRVLHTINPRLHPEQIAWIINHAEDVILCFDTTFTPLIQAVHSKCPGVKKWVAMCDADKLPADTGIPNLVSYENWLAGQSSQYRWPQLDENTASSMCYTSDTTGNPKAAVYSHRTYKLFSHIFGRYHSIYLSKIHTAPKYIYRNNKQSSRLHRYRDCIWYITFIHFYWIHYSACNLFRKIGNSDKNLERISNKWSDN